MSKKEEKQLQTELGAMEARDEEQRQEELVKENKLGTMPVFPLLMNVSVPIVISMLVQALYNVVDSIFVARLGEGALAAVGLVFPVQNLMIAVAVGTGVGVSSRLGRRLGERNIESANRVATNGIFLLVLSWVVFALVGIFGTGIYMGSYSQNPEIGADIAKMGSEYMSIVCIGSLGLFLSIILERLLQATGRSMLSMAAQLSGALTNIILDPIMIFGLFGFPKLGVAGAAWATIIGQFVGMGIALWLNLAKNKELRLKIKGFRPNLTTIRHIYQVGFPSIVMQSIGSIMTFGINQILMRFGSVAISVFSVYFKLQSFVFMPVMGFNNGLVSVVAFNYGARKPSRIATAIRACLLVNFGIMVAGTLLFWLGPQWLLSLFNAGPEMTEMGVGALRFISLCFPVVAVCTVLSSVFQALGKGWYSLIMSVVRQLGFLLPIAYLLARWKGLPYLWLSFPAAELVAVAIAVGFFRALWKQQIVPMRLEQDEHARKQAIEKHMT